MAKKKQSDYGKAFRGASAALTAMKIEKGRVHGGFYLGSGDRAESIARLRRWVEIAAEHLSVEQIDQTAWRIPLQLNVQARLRGDYGAPGCGSGKRNSWRTSGRIGRCSDDGRGAPAQGEGGEA